MSKPLPLYGIALAVLVILLFSAYSNTFFNLPVMDDFHSFVDEPNVQIESVSLDSLKRLSRTEFGFSRLIPMATFAWDFFLGKGHVWVFHVTNFLIHLLCGVTLFFFLKVLFKCAELQDCEGHSSSRPRFWLIFCIVGLWALCPVQTNVVTYLVQRMTSLATLFYLISLTFYLQARLCQRGEGASAKIVAFYFVVAVSALGSFLSKQITATLPVVILILEVMFFTPDLLWQIAKRKKIFWLLASLVVITGIFFVVVMLPPILNGYGSRHFTLSERMLTELRVVSSYLFLLLLPLPRFMNFEHDVALSTSLISPSSTIFSLVFLLCLLILAWEIRHRQKLLSFGIIWFFINLMIESTFIPLELKFEHRLYLPSIGFYLALVLGIKAFFEKFSFTKTLKVKNNKALIISSIFILLAAFSSMTYARNSCWVDNLTLYSDCVRKAPGKARNHVNLARAYALVGAYDKTIDEGEAALLVGQRGYEEYWGAVCNIVSAYIAKGDIQEAIQKGESFLRGNIPERAKQNSYPLVLHNLGMAYLRSDDYSAAYSHFLQAFDFMVQCDKLHNLSDFEADLVTVLSKVYDEQDDLAEEIGLDLNDKSTIYRILAELFYERGRFDRALYYCEWGLNENPDTEWCAILQQKIENDLEANQLQLERGTLKSKYLSFPFHSRFNFYMTIAYLQEKMNLSFGGGVLFSLARAKEINPLSTDINLLESWYLYKQKKIDAALEVIDRGIQLDPGYARLWVNRAIYALTAGYHQEALYAANKVLILYPGYPYRNKIEAIKNAAEMGLNKDS